ncbi:MAG: SDR family oxidoreductase [Bacteroidales bacterium]|nr:SDR family oxidoreductase [Bacteroidales bacterium]
MNVIITGASRGIGYELAKKFVRDGHKTLAIARNQEKLRQLEKELKTEHFSSLGFDLSTGDYRNKLVPFVKQRLGTVDLLINNAGLLINKAFGELTDDDFDQLFKVNVKSAFKLTRDLLPLINANAHILNISSMGGVQGSTKFPGLSLYSASKAALAVLTECMSEEFKSRNIKANALALGAVQTEMLSEAFPGYQAPLQAGEMAGFIMDFALNGHRYFNGKILPVSLSTP